MKFIVILLLSLSVTVVGVLTLLEDPGYVLFSYAETTVETTISMLALLLVLLVAGAVLVFRLLRVLFDFPDRMYVWGQRHREKRSRDQFYRGLFELAQGHWKKSEKLLIKSVDSSEMPVLNYLTAARAAQHQGKHARRDHYLQLASNVKPESELAIGLTQAELQIVQGQHEQAFASLSRLLELDQNNPCILEMLLGLYQQLGEWELLKDKLPEIWKHGIISDQQASLLEVEVSINILQLASRQGVDSLLNAFNGFTSELYYNEPVVKKCVQLFLQLDAQDEAETILQKALDKKWSKSLVYLYGQVLSSQPEQQLKYAEGWEKDFGRDAIVQLTLGRICMRNKLWGKARAHLEASLSLGCRAEAYFELGVLLQHLEDMEGALASFRSGLDLAVSDIKSQIPDFSAAD